uniref:Putative salivary lipocalin n=1 Tax=Rhipicephalus microplus TaxID=6941 RepID=A0A6M2D979_RHIMP
MPAHGVWSLFLFSSSMLMALAGRNKTNVPGEWRRTSPWAFMNSKDIYLNLTTLDWPDIKCIRAKPVLKSKTAQTLSQTILIKMAIGEVIIWARSLMNRLTKLERKRLMKDSIQNLLPVALLPFSV